MMDRVAADVTGQLNVPQSNPSKAASQTLY